MVSGIFLLNNMPARVLFDSGATHSFVTPFFGRHLGVLPVMLANAFIADTASGTSLIADRVYTDCTLEVDDYKFDIDLIPIDIRGFDVTIGMNWLSKNVAEIVCYKR